MMACVHYIGLNAKPKIQMLNQDLFSFDVYKFHEALTFSHQFLFIFDKLFTQYFHTLSINNMYQDLCLTQRLLFGRVYKLDNGCGVSF